MDGRGAGSCVMFGLAPSSPSFSVSISVKLSVTGRGGAGKGGSRVLIPDLVVMAKVALISKWKKCSGVVTCHPTDHLGIGHILQFESTILLRHYAAFPLREKWKNLNLDVSLVAPSACSVLLDEDASSSKRFLPAIARDSF
ncbi:hypothetical protein Tco_0807751 [Tanacetum coccineum]